MVDAWEEEFRRFQDMMSRMFEELWLRPRGRFLAPGRALLPREREAPPAEYREPSVDVVETDTEVIATADMPGIEKQDIKINLTKNRLEISAETKREEKREERGYVYRERRRGAYYRAIPLPTSVDPDNSKATYMNGILEIRMQKMEAKERKTLTVE